MSKELSDKQQFFCREYLIDLNGTQAAIRAGYSSKTAYSQAERLLRNVEIQNFICELKSKRVERTDITADRVLKEIAKIAFIDIRKYYNDDGSIKPIHELDDEAAAALSGVDIDEIYSFDNGRKSQIGETKKIKLHSKIAALDQLAKHTGIYEKDNSQKSVVYNTEITPSEAAKISKGLENEY